MIAHHTRSAIRTILFWGIPAVLAATVAWTFLPRGHVVSRVSPPVVSPQAGGPTPAPATPAEPPSQATPAAPQPSPATPPSPTQSPGDPSPSSADPQAVQPDPQAVQPPNMGLSAQPAPAPGGKPFAEIRQGDLEGTDESGRPQWRIVADTVTVVHDKDLVLLQNVKATFFERNGGTIVVTGAQGRYDTKTHEVEISGNVHGKSNTGRELFADRLHYAPRAGKLTGTGHIRLLQGRVVMYADGMTSDVTLGRTQFFGNVHASVH